MRKTFRMLSTTLSLALLVTTLSPASASAANITSKIVIASDMVGERTNVQFIEGTPGDTHLVYTYQQNGNMYKAIENASDDFRNVECQIFQLNENGIYVENSTQCVSMDSEGNPLITIKSFLRDTEQRTIDISTITPSFLQSDSTARVPDGEWITEYYDGSKGDIKGLAISVLISVVTTIATYHTRGALSAGLVSGAGTIASSLFGQNAENVYYHAICNWRHSSKNYLVIDETEWTEFFLDSSHTYSLGHTYAEYIF
ncbi:hypothetical protein [Faecalimonas umbilicata]|uniref:hypothetical protein n=1 Tax=Faecalimonas umbilicata TaxID=1912855 RepID=UPI0039937701